MAGAQRYPVIAGPTAAGKSELAVEVALRLDGEIVSADAFQVYRGMDIGTGKLTMAQRRGVPHHLIDVVEPTEPFSVNQWLGLANAAIADIRSRGKTPVVVGGTHLYVKALLDGMFDGPGPDAALREELRSMDPRVRRAELERVDPSAAARLHPNDERRTVRALEVFRQTGKPISAWQSQWDRGEGDAARVLVVIQWPAEELSRRINARVKAMMEAGLEAEVRRLHDARRLGAQAGEALGYKQIVRYLNGNGSLEDAVEQTKIETRQFAKAQRTWLRRLGGRAGTVAIAAGTAARDGWAQVVVDACLVPHLPA